MTEAMIYSLIGELANGQVYPYVAPLTSEGEPSINAPWIIYSVNGADYDDTLCGSSECNESIQIDIYADSIDEAQKLRKEAVNLASTLGITKLQFINMYEHDTSLYRATAEFELMS